MEHDASGPAHPVYQTPPTEPRATIYYLQLSTAQLLDPRLAVEERERVLAHARREHRPVLVLDVSGKVFTPGSLQELLLPLAQRVQSGELGAHALVVVAFDPGVAEFVRLLASGYDLPLYVADQPHVVQRAEPLGKLTTTEMQTINAVATFGGSTTVAAFADLSNLQVNAAGNRLINLSKRGYLYREPRSRRDGDAFIDPRHEAHLAYMSEQREKLGGK